MAAVMFTDLVGFTSLAHTDESTALGVVDATNRLVQPIVREHFGRTVKSTGDGLLLEFPSARGAVLCALAVQDRLRSVRGGSRAGQLPLRIGVHSGDVERRGRDVLGDTVNVASRLEALSPPGGLCISRSVLDQVRSSVPLDVQPVRGRSLKGLGTSVEAYRVLPKAAPRGAGGLPDGVPRLAVLPLANYSPSPADAYIADGFTEELIAMLSQLDGVRVIARTSVMHYQADPRPISEVARELQVESILEGSVRRAADALRVTLQLIDANSEEHVWSRTYDRDLKDLLRVQREIAEDVSARFRATIESTTRGRRTETASPRSHLAYLRGMASLREETADGAARAGREFLRAIRLDSRNARAYCGLAEARQTEWYYRVFRGRTPFRDTWTELVERALELDPHLAAAHVTLGGILVSFRRDWKGGESEFRRALRTDPGFAEAHMALGETVEALGRLEEAGREFRLARELDPLSLQVARDEFLNAIWRRRYRAADASLKRLRALEGRRRVEGFGSTAFEAMLASVTGDERRWDRAYRRAVRLARTPAQRVELSLTRAAHRRDPRRFRRLIPRAKRLLAPPRLSVNLAGGYAMLGQMDDAFTWLHTSIRDPGVALTWWRFDPRYANVRRDPRWPAFLREALRPVTTTGR